MVIDFVKKGLKEQIMSSCLAFGCTNTTGRIKETFFQNSWSKKERVLCSYTTLETPNFFSVKSKGLFTLQRAPFIKFVCFIDCEKAAHGGTKPEPTSYFTIWAYVSTNRTKRIFQRLEKLERSLSDITTASHNLVICLHEHGKCYANMTSQPQKIKSALIFDLSSPLKWQKYCAISLIKLLYTYHVIIGF